MSTGFVRRNNNQLPFFLAAPAFIWQMLFLYFPLALLVVMSFLSRDGVTSTYRITAEYYQEIFDKAHLFIMSRSFVLALITVIITLLLAYPVSFYLARIAGRFKNLLLFFLVLPFWTNFLVQVYAWFFILEQKGLINTLFAKIGLGPFALASTSFAVYLVMVYCYLPFAVMPIYAILEKLNPSVFEASADLGATPWQTFVNVILPMTASGVRTAFFLVFVPAFGEFVIPALLGGGKKLYVGTLISHYFLDARNFNLGASFTTISGITLLVCVLFFYRLFVWVFPNLSEQR